MTTDQLVMIPIDYYTVVDDEEEDDIYDNNEAWYKKALFVIDWVNKFLQTYCVYPGFAISIDEIMMKLFKGRSNMTHIMKSKPIPKGYKLYAMCCATSGYYFFFFPDHGLKDKKKQMIHRELCGVSIIYQIERTNNYLFYYDKNNDRYL